MRQPGGAEHGGGPIRLDDRDDPGTIVLRRELRSVGRARAWLRSVLAGRVSERHAGDAVLVVSELVTNALRHGLGDVVLRTTIDDDTTSVQIAVTDSGEDQPTLLPLDPHRIGGVGLRIVDEVAASWGVAAFPGGKTTWAVVAPPA